MKSRCVGQRAVETALFGPGESCGDDGDPTECYLTQMHCTTVHKVNTSMKQKDLVLCSIISSTIPLRLPVRVPNVDWTNMQNKRRVQYLLVSDTRARTRDGVLLTSFFLVMTRQQVKGQSQIGERSFSRRVQHASLLRLLILSVYWPQTSGHRVAQCTTTLTTTADTSSSTVLE